MRITIIQLAILLLLFHSCQQNNASKDDPRSSSQAISISNAPQLFLDDSLIAKTSNLKRVIQRPKKHPANPVIVQGTPWEQRYMQMYGTVLYDEEMNRFRAWYMASESEEKKPETYICYAESLDGVHWNKPLVGAITLPGHTQHNAVLAGAHGLCVMKDREEPDPAKRYKGLGGEVLAFSPDGIHWTTETFQSAGQNDTSSSFVKWNGEYLAFIRNQERFRGSIREYTRLSTKNVPFLKDTIREVAFTTSPDFSTWAPKETIFTSDLHDGYPWTQPYGVAVSPYGDQLIGLIWFLHLDHVIGNNNQGAQKVQLIVSRDGRRWNRVADRAIFLETSAGKWDRGRVYPSTSLVLKDDQIYIYYTGSDTRHGEDWGTVGIGLATLPADRFVALTLQDESTEGVLETRLLHMAGKNLIVNAEISENDLQAVLLNEKGKVIPGFDRNCSHLTQQDALRYRITWSTNKTLQNALSDSPLSIRFYLRKGSLFAFQAEPVEGDSQIPKPSNSWSDYRTQYERDRATLTEAIKTNPNSASLYLERGKLHVQAGNRQLGIDDFTKAIELDPSNTEAYFERGKNLFFRTEFVPAYYDYKKIIELNPMHAGAYSWLGIIFYETKIYEKALDILSRGIKKLPDNSTLYCDRGYVYLNTNQYEKALLDYNHAIEFNPMDFDSFFERGVTQRHLMNHERAIQDFTKALEFSPQDDWVLCNRGFSYVQLKKYEPAIADFSNAISIKPDNDFAFRNRACLYAETRKYDPAIQDFNKAIQFEPDNPNLFFLRGHSYFLSRKLESAIADFTQAYILNPGNITYKQLLGHSDYMNLDYSTSINVLSRITQDDPWIDYSLARVYSLRSSTRQQESEKRQDILSALEYLERSVKAGLKDWKILAARPEFSILHNEDRYKRLIENNE